MNIRAIAQYAALALCCVLAACGGSGGDGDAGSPPPSSGTLVGPAGGTVNGPNGAKVVIPPGALATDTAISIEESSAGAPDLPVSLTARGPMYAFTPHGTTFAVPVMLTLPFDGSSIPTGSGPVFYKTNAQNEWERVAGATFDNGIVTAQITSFSNGQSGIEALDCPQRVWFFAPITNQPVLSTELQPTRVGEMGCGELKESFTFGAADATFEQDFGLTPQLAVGEVFSSTDGVTFSVFAEAPSGDPNLVGFRNGGLTQLRQFQSYVKRSPNATLQLELTLGFLAASDFNGRPVSIECFGVPLETLTDEQVVKFCTPIFASIDFELRAYHGVPTPTRRGLDFFTTHGIADMKGFDGTWKFRAEPVGDANTPLWTETNFTRQGLEGQQPLVQLNTPFVLNIDLSSIDVCEPSKKASECADRAFTVSAVMKAEAWNWRGRESGAAAFLRDPQKIGGQALRVTGLEATNNPAPLPTEQAEPIACTTGPDPAAGVLQFSAAAYSANEGSGKHGGASDILVTRTEGSKGAVSVAFSAASGTAAAGVDFDAPPITVRFADGDTASRRIPVTVLVSNTLPEPNKTLTLSLSNPGGCATLGQNTSAVLTINDDDSAPQPPLTSFRIGGTVSGLAGSGLVLQNLGTNDLGPANGGFFFTTAVANGIPYNVTVATQPTQPAQICTVTNGSGTIAGADVTNVTVTCATPPPTGGLDASFGGGGKVTTAFGGANSAMALQADGRIVMAGGSGADFVLARYNADGTLDTSFGTGGLVTTDVGANAPDEARGVAIQPDGKIVVVGNAVVGRTSSNQSNFDFAVARYNVDGSLDTTFGNGGKVTTDFNGELDRAFAVAIQGDGKIVVVGSTTGPIATGLTSDFGIARYQGNGALDTGFGSGGKVITDIGGAIDIAQNVVLQSDGAILVSGVLTLGSSPVLAHGGLARYDASGRPDTGFGTGGKVTLPNQSLGEALALTSDGKILVAGNAVVGGSVQFALARLNADGRVDSGFGTVTTGFTTLDDFARAVAVMQDGRIVVAGQSANKLSNPDFAVARYTAAGAPDTTFGTGGKLTVDFFGSFDGAESVIVQPDGRILLGGFARNGTRTGYGLARLNP